MCEEKKNKQMHKISVKMFGHCVFIVMVYNLLKPEKKLLCYT